LPAGQETSQPEQACVGGAEHEVPGPIGTAWGGGAMMGPPHLQYDVKPFDHHSPSQPWRPHAIGHFVWASWLLCIGPASIVLALESGPLSMTTSAARNASKQDRVRMKNPLFFNGGAETAA
jgi:hypothetical protein